MFGNFVFFAKFCNSVSQKCFVMQIIPYCPYLLPSLLFYPYFANSVGIIIMNIRLILIQIGSIIVKMQIVVKIYM